MITLVGKIEPAPAPGTREFADMMCGHFQGLSEALRDVIGPETFGKYCSMMFGVQVRDPEGRPAIELRAIGGLRNSINVCAMIMRLAAKNLVKNAGMSEQEALMAVLEDLKSDVINYDAHTLE